MRMNVDETWCQHQTRRIDLTLGLVRQVAANRLDGVVANGKVCDKPRVPRAIDEARATNQYVDLAAALSLQPARETHNYEQRRGDEQGRVSGHGSAPPRIVARRGTRLKGKRSAQARAAEYQGAER